MKWKEKMHNFYKTVDQKFLQQFGFRMRETSFLNIVDYLHVPKDSSSLAVTRILFGLTMLFDIPSERGGAIMNRQWGRRTCHFPLLPVLTAVPMPYMAVVYALLWLGALGMMCGYKYRISSITFTICYWYLFLIEKSYWNNHSYLFGLVALLLSCTEAGCFWSIDTHIDPAKEKRTVPYWNYFLLKYQFFILYFMAGMKKGTAEWLTGYSVQKLGEHWVFDPFKLFLTVPQIDYLIVHWFIFMFDLTVAIWMMWERTRHIAMFFCAMFHLMNTRLFRIGMFPWVCLATMPLYYPFDWPKIYGSYLKNQYLKIKALICSYFNTFNNCPNCNCKTKEEDEDNSNILEDFDNNADRDNGDTKDGNIDGEDCENKQGSIYTQQNNGETHDNTKKDNSVTNENSRTSESGKENYSTDFRVKGEILGNSKNVSQRKKLTACMILFYVFMQAFLPYSHFITKGYNNWTNGLYGYSWDMMIHTWDTQSVVVKIVNNENHHELYIDPYAFAPNDRWARHGDMVYQYAKCLHQNLLKEKDEVSGISKNMSIYVDVWTSMNGRFTQRLFDSKVDLLKASWSPFEKISFVMPLLDEALHWRSTLEEVAKEVYSWNNKSDVLFFADFPNYEHEKYISAELSNVSLTVLEGVIFFEPEATFSRPGKSYKLTSGNKIAVDSGLFHKVLNIGESPAYYMYTFMNESEIISNFDKEPKRKLPIFMELYARIKDIVIFGVVVGKSLLQILYGCNGKCS